LQEYFTLDWEQVLVGYLEGIFPMGNDNGSISWYEADPRAIIPVESDEDNLKIPRSLRQVLSKDIFEIRHNSDFETVIRHCAKREFTWINELIINAFNELHKRGFGHSIEAWKDGKLAGGLYGIAFRGAFFGESMFYKENNASKVCVVNLFEILKRNNFLLFDIQMMTPHFKSLGAIEIGKEEYFEKLDHAMNVERQFFFK
jgi:leucyl/phenylalanyl-tRNA--protein transferase